MYNICLWNVVEKCKVAENKNTQAKYLKIVLKNTTWVNVLSDFSTTGFLTLWPEKPLKTHG